MKETMLKLAAAAVGGAVATFMMQQAMANVRRMPKRLRPPAQKADPGHFMVRQGERLLGKLPRRAHRTAAQGLHWAYGMSWPLALAALSSALGMRSGKGTVAAGAAMGALVWAIGYGGWLPVAGLTKPLDELEPEQIASSLLTHVAWGKLAALPLALVSRRA